MTNVLIPRLISIIASIQAKIETMKKIFTASKVRHFVLSLRQNINFQPVKDNRQQIHHEQEILAEKHGT